MKFLKLFWSGAKAFLKMLALGGGIIFSLSLIWYVIPDEIKSWVTVFMGITFLFALAAGIKELKEVI